MVDSMVSLAVEKLAKVLEDEVVSLVGVTNEIEKLSSTFTLLQAVLKDAETRRVKDEAVKKWLGNLKDVAYDVDDILDEWMTEALDSQAPDEDGVSRFSKKVTRLLWPVNCSNYFKLRQKYGSRLKEVRGRLDDIEKVMNLLRLSGDSGERERVESALRRGERETGSLLDQSSVVGREDDKNEVLHLLLRERSGEVNEVPFVISIVGMGGLGKTTLAQLAYNDEEVKVHFQMRMWVCVSEEFDVKRITKSIIQSATGTGCEPLDLDQLQCRLREMLYAKRFLLVLDDIWSEDTEKWDRLKLPFQTGASGSRILITTRNEKVALAMGRVHICKLAVLSHADCWLVFRRKALEHRSAEELSELEAIGKEIVNRCGGLPLAAKTIGSAMCSRKTRREWELVLESDIWNLHDDVLQGVLPALLLSYHDLPPALKQCFAYFSIFPKDWKIEKDMTVKLWVAQGFIRSNRSTDIEEIGGLYFDDLLRRSLLQDAELDDDRSIVKCKMHDLVHDLAQSVAGSDSSLFDIREQASLNLSNVRHSSLIYSDAYGDEVASIWPTLYKAEKLRTLLCGSNSFMPMVPNDLFHHFRHLRALDLHGTSIQKLPGTVGKLKQLRYLDLSRTEIEELPEEVSNCGNLQTLILNKCYRLKTLPRGLTKMINLRHLALDATISLEYLPQGIGSLSSLRTLSKLIVEGGIEGCKWGEVKQLINHFHLQGRLEIIGLEKVKSRDEAREAELYKQQDIYAIYYEYRVDVALDDDDDEVKRMEDVLEVLKPHTNLKELNILRYRGWVLPKWIEDPVFSNLVTVTLRHCDKCKQLPGLGKLPSLKYLNIEGMYEVRKVGGEFRGDDNNDGSGGVVSFPKLETLTFRYMSNWEEWELRGGDGEVMPKLLELEIQNCPELKALPNNLSPLLQKLAIDEYRGWKLPKWIEDPVFSNLVTVFLSDCDKFKQLPGLGKLPSLKRLEIVRMKEVRKVGGEFSGDDNNDGSGGGVVSFPMLETLRIREMSNWEEWELRSGDGEVMPSLLQLTIHECPKLKELPSNLPPLLQTLTLSIGNDGLPSGGPLPILSNLNNLVIWGIGELTSFPCGWLGQLKALQTLEIYACPKLRSLRVEELQQLTMLQRLTIMGSPLLRERYGGGEDRDKIAHIPNISI